MLACLIAFVAHDSHHSHHRFVAFEAAMADAGQRRLSHVARESRQKKLHSLRNCTGSVSVSLSVRTFTPRLA